MSVGESVPSAIWQLDNRVRNRRGSTELHCNLPLTLDGKWPILYTILHSLYCSCE